MSTSKKVLFITNHFYPHKGGVEKHILNVCRCLNNDYEFCIITKRESKQQYTYSRYKNISIYRINTPDIKFIGLIIIWIQMFLKINIIYTSDIIHVHDVFVWYLPIRAFLFWKKSYLTIHGWEGKYPIPLNSRLQKKIATMLARGYISVGDYLSKYFGMRKSLITYGGVSRKFFTNKKKSNKIVFLGRLNEDTGIKMFLEGINNVNGHKIVFCGDGLYRNECEKYGRVTGFVSDPSKYLVDAKYCVAGGYMATLEGLASNCLVINIAQNRIRKDIFRMSPFSKFVRVAQSSEDIAQIILKPDKRFIDKTNIKAGNNWAKAQTWEKVSGLYVELWNK